jgi:uncharacterized membrane protein
MDPRTSLRSRLPRLLPLLAAWSPHLLPLLAAWCFYASLSHEAARRILALDTVENYGFAVFNQLLWNFSHAGHFAQTIHRGYVDSWIWSGHKAALLPVVGWLYGLRPSPLWLAQLQIGAVALGAFPAWALGRRCVGGIPGGVVGLALYFGFPPLYYIALSDYQDIVLAVPLLLVALHQCRRGSWRGFALAALAACLAREEVPLMIALVGLSTPGGWRRRARFGLLGAGIAALYLGTVYALFHQDMIYESSAQTQLKALLAHFPPILPPLRYDRLEAARFYAGFLRPVQWLGLLSPLTLLPGLGAFAFHLLVNPGNGVDRVWTHHAHIHHLAPLIPLLTAASLDTLGRVSARLKARAGSAPVDRAAPILLASVVVVAALAGTLPTVRSLGLELEFTLRPKAWPVDPVWRLVRQVPANAVMATDMNASLAISSRHEAYTYDDSLTEKVPGPDPLERVDYLLVNRRDAAWEVRGRAVPGAVVIDQSDRYVLLKLR